jgi:hypothetical protein
MARKPSLPPKGSRDGSRGAEPTDRAPHEGPKRESPAAPAAVDPAAPASAYAVGYGRPPKHSQFKLGERRNPTGRPKGARNLGTDVKDALRKLVTIVENGRRRKVTTQQAAIMKLLEKAIMKGDARALQTTLEMAGVHNNEPAPPDADHPLSAEDEAILAAHEVRIRATPLPSSDPPPEPSKDPLTPRKRRPGRTRRKQSSLC